MKEEMRKDIENWLDANVWDGDPVSNCPPSKKNNHTTHFNPHDLCQLSMDLVDHILEKVHDVDTNTSGHVLETDNVIYEFDDKTLRRLKAEQATEDLPEDKGKHYRFSFKGIKFDPYRVAKMYGLTGGPREHMLKKLLRGEGKGHTEEDLIKELQCCLDRWKEMVEEDSEENS